MAFIHFTDQSALRNPWLEFERIRQGFDEFLRSYAEKGRMVRCANVYPALNIFEDADKTVITAEMPGGKSEDLDISLKGDTLTIQGKRADRSEEGLLSWHRREIETGSFSRSLSLPAQVDADRINAKLANGVLTLTLMKSEAAKPRQIQVQSA